MSSPIWKPVARLAAGLVLVLCSLALRATTPFSRLWWLNDSHIPVPVNDILQDGGGAMWLATDAGVYRFTGTGFVHLRDSGGAVTCLHRSADGILAGYRSGRIARVVQDSLVTIPLPGGNPDGAITSFASWGGVIAFGTLGRGIWALQGGTLTRFTTANGLSDDYVYHLRIARPGRLLAATDRGLNELSQEAGTIRVRRVLQEGIVQAMRPWPARTAQDGVLVGLNEGPWLGLVYDRNGDLQVAWKDSLPAPVVDFAEVNGRLFVLTDNSSVYAYRFPEGRAQRDSFSVDQGGSCLLAGTGGTLWTGNSSGLVASTAGYLGKIAAAQGCRLSSVSSIAALDGTIYYGQADTLVGIRADGSFMRTAVPAQITTLTADSSGLWIGTLGSGIWMLDRNGALFRPGGSAAFAREHVLSMTVHAGRVWVSTLSGLDEFRIERGSLQRLRHHSKQGGLGADYVYQCVADHLGRIWIATDGAGVCCFDGRTYRRWTEGQEGFRGRTVYSIAEDRSGRIWAATLEHGICRYDGRRWTSIGRVEGLQSLNVVSLAALADGQMLIVHDQGLDLWQPANGAFRHIGRRQGMDIDSSSKMLNCAAGLPDGSVITPFEDGMLHFMPAFTAVAVPPGVRLTEVIAGGKPSGLSRQHFEPDDNSLAFRFEGNNLLNSERLYYRYRLQGFTNEWIMTRDESASFARLPPGGYVFEVQAAYSPSFARPAVARYRFSIAPPIWRRWWAIGVAVLLLSGAGLLIVRYRERNIRRIEQLQRARVQMEYEHLKSQINPHFLFNSLNILGTLIGRDPVRAKEYTYALSDLYRNTLHYRDKELIPLEEEWAILMQYLLVQQTRFGAALSIESDIPAERFRTGRVVPLALQLLVENAIKHNIVAASSPLTITIMAAGDLLVISNPYRPKRNPEKGTGIGLANIRSRYGMHGAEVRYGLHEGIFTVELPLL